MRFAEAHDDGTYRACLEDAPLEPDDGHIYESDRCGEWLYDINNPLGGGETCTEPVRRLRFVSRPNCTSMN